MFDCSFAVALALRDESGRERERSLGHLSKVGALWVPALWWYELSNALAVAHRRRRLAEADITYLTELYGMLPIETDAYLDLDRMWRFYSIAQEYNLSAYDAAYLELAQRRGIGLATFDKRLASGARKAGIKIIS